MTHALLIAEDSDYKTMLIQGMLFKAGWDGEIFIATTTEAAMSLIDTHPHIQYGLIDFHIPSQNGPAVIAYLKSKNPNARIALVSSSDKYENQEEAKAAGAEVCICTSYEADEVAKALMDTLTAWQSE